jgi:thiol:disulfide interchange protein
LILKSVGSIEAGWYVYASDFDANLGPQLTLLELKNAKAKGVLKSIQAKTKFDAVWGGNIRYFKEKAVLEQKIEPNTSIKTIKGSLTGQVCNDADGKCVLFDESFSLEIPTNKNSSKVEQKPKTQLIPSPITEVTQKDSAVQPLVSDSAKSIAQKNIETNSITKPKKKEQTSLWGFMLAAFLTGLAALITPCVFPMIPMTVTFFLKGSKSRAEAIGKAFIYGFSIVGIYTIVGVLVAKLAGPETANFLSTHWAPNLFFFAAFMIFAASFLGMFEIVLPSSFVNAVDQQADRGGYLGIFFMAFTLVLVSFSCTGPIVGSILVESANGQFIKPIVGMFAFSMAFAIPFTLFAIFPEWLQNLPKSGSWLNSVKVVLGFIEFALAFKFLSLADQAYHWNILSRELNLAIWIATGLITGLYLLGKIQLPHDQPAEHISVPRLILALLCFTFVAYITPGLWGAPLKTFSGYLPPLNTSSQWHSNTSVSKQPTSDQLLCTSPSYADQLHLPHDLSGYFDLNEALACAQKLQKPVFVDFTGHGCVNCREMESNVWSSPEILPILKDQYIIAALYVDDKTELPESLWYT